MIDVKWATLQEIGRSVEGIPPGNLRMESIERHQSSLAFRCNDAATLPVPVRSYRGRGPGMVDISSRPQPTGIAGAPLDSSAATRLGNR